MPIYYLVITCWMIIVKLNILNKTKTRGKEEKNKTKEKSAQTRVMFVEDLSRLCKMQSFAVL